MSEGNLNKYLTTLINQMNFLQKQNAVRSKVLAGQPCAEVYAHYLAAIQGLNGSAMSITMSLLVAMQGELQ